MTMVVQISVRVPAVRFVVVVWINPKVQLLYHMVTGLFFFFVFFFLVI